MPARGSGARAILLCALVVSCLLSSQGAAIGDGDAERIGKPRPDDVVLQLEREAQQDERRAAAEADKARADEKELGEDDLATRFSDLGREIDTDHSASAAAEVLNLALDAGDGRHPADGGDATLGKPVDARTEDGGTVAREAPPRVSGANIVPGESSLETALGEGENVLALVEDAESTKGGRGTGGSDGGGDDTASDMSGGRDLITEAELEGGCLGECQGSCLAACLGAGAQSSPNKDTHVAAQCERKCNSICVGKCRLREGSRVSAPDHRASRLQMKDAAAAARAAADDAAAGALLRGRTWGWEQQMAEDKAAGKTTREERAEAARGRPMDHECKKECMRKCGSKCKRKSPTPDKCPAQCNEQCDDDCYIVEDGGEPDAGTWMADASEEGECARSVRCCGGGLYARGQRGLLDACVREPSGWRRETSIDAPASCVRGIVRVVVWPQGFWFRVVGCRAGVLGCQTCRG